MDSMAWTMGENGLRYHTIVRNAMSFNKQISFNSNNYNVSLKKI